MGVVQQGVVCHRQPQADNSSQEEEGEHKVISGSDRGVSTCKILLDIPLAKQKGNP